jgi:hypothetical protein
MNQFFRALTIMYSASPNHRIVYYDIGLDRIEKEDAAVQWYSGS